jgi:hypothetical protein
MNGSTISESVDLVILGLVKSGHEVYIGKGKSDASTVDGL